MPKRELHAAFVGNGIVSNVEIEVGGISGTLSVWRSKHSSREDTCDANSIGFRINKL